MAHPKYSKEEVVRRGQEVWEKHVRALVDEATNFGRVVVIDVLSGDYEMDDDNIVAVHRLRERHPDGALFGMRVGYPAFTKIGGSWETVCK